MSIHFSNFDCYHVHEFCQLYSQSQFDLKVIKLNETCFKILNNQPIETFWNYTSLNWNSVSAQILILVLLMRFSPPQLNIHFRNQSEKILLKQLNFIQKSPSLFQFHQDQQFFFFSISLVLLFHLLKMRNRCWLLPIDCILVYPFLLLLLRIYFFEPIGRTMGSFRISRW